MKKIMLILSIILLIPTMTYASESTGQQYSEGFQDSRSSVSITNLSDTKSILVDRNNQEVHVVNLESLQDIWSRKFPKIYDIKVLASPTKIVVITKEQNKLLKYTIDENGKVLSQQYFSSPSIHNLMKKDQVQISWSAPFGKTKEKLAIHLDNKVSIFEYPWKSPSSSLSISPGDIPYEGISTDEIQLSWPFLVVKYTGDSLMQIQELYHVFNLNNKQSFEVKMDYNTYSRYSLENGILVLSTSSILYHPMGINRNTDYMIYSRYNLTTGKPTVQLKRQFKDSHLGWRTNYHNQKLYLADLSENTYELLDKVGTLIKKSKQDIKTLELNFVSFQDNQFIVLAPMDNKSVHIQRISAD